MESVKAALDPVSERIVESGVGELAWITTTGPKTSNTDIQRTVRRHVMLGKGGKKVLKAGGSSKALSLAAARRTTGSSQHLLHPRSEATLTITKHPQYQRSLPIRSPPLLNPRTSSAELAESIPNANTTQSTCLICAHSAPGQEMQHQGYCASRKSLFMEQISDFCARQRDPFVRYPIDVTPQDVKLIDFVFDEGNSNKVLFRQAFFPIGLSDPAAFHQMLGNFALWLPPNMSVKGSAKYGRRDALAHQAQAIEAVNRKLRDGVDVTSDGIIGAVLGFTYHAHVMLDFPAWNNHMNGLKQIVKLRGGLRSLKPLYMRTLHWCTQDVPLTFDWQEEMVGGMRPLEPPDEPLQVMEQLKSVWLRRFSDHRSFFSIFEYLTRLVIYFRNESNLNWGIFEINAPLRAFINPLLGHLLNIYSKKTSEDANSAWKTIEACRLTAILFLAPVRRYFSVYPVRSTVQEAKLRQVLKKNDINWQGLEILRSWILTIGYLEAVGDQAKSWWEGQRRVWLFQDPDAYTRAEVQLRDVLWIDSIHGNYLLNANIQLGDVGLSSPEDISRGLQSEIDQRFRQNPAVH